MKKSEKLKGEKLKIDPPKTPSKPVRAKSAKTKPKPEVVKVELRGVRQNNLKNIDVDFPHRKLTVVCGPSGSGKSSLVFETLFAHGQRQYLENFSNYIKQFLNLSKKPMMDAARNVPPAISLEQKNNVKNRRSTVATVTGLGDLMRFLFSEIGKPYCMEHEYPVVHKEMQENLKEIYLLEKGYIVIPMKPPYNFKRLLGQGFIRVMCEGEVHLLEDISEDSKFAKKEIFLVIDRLSFKKENEERILDSIDQAFIAYKDLYSHLTPTVQIRSKEGKVLFFKDQPCCIHCGICFPKITHSLFSFNHPEGLCQGCQGFGYVLTLQMNKVVPQPRLSIEKGALKPFEGLYKKHKTKVVEFCKQEGIPVKKPWIELSEQQKQKIWKGDGKYKGIVGFFKQLEKKKYKMHIRILFFRFQDYSLCSTCKGARLNDFAGSVFIDKRNIHQMGQVPLYELESFIKDVKLSSFEKQKSQEILLQIQKQISVLSNLGLGYLTLNRETRTLSGGEYQRVLLAKQLGVRLSEAMYILDEPTKGLHPRDTYRLVEILKQLTEENTVVVVEHDKDIILSADHNIEIGPQSGTKGGEVLFQGESKNFLKQKTKTIEFLKSKNSLLRKAQSFLLEKDMLLHLKGCNTNNLKNIDVVFPLHRLVGVSGVSGSGKSTLVMDILYPSLVRVKNGEEPVGCVSLEGTEYVSQVFKMDQTSPSTNARSHIASYMKIFDDVRSLFAESGSYSSSYFTTNKSGGRCEHCEGLGYQVEEMIFLDDVKMVCEFCDGDRYKKEILKIKYKGKNIKEVLSMTVEEAGIFFEEKRIHKALDLLKQVGLGYICLGQSTSSFSGGEVQRLKIAKHLHQDSEPHSVYIFDEPSTGLSFMEMNLLIRVFDYLVSEGNTVIVIEHNQQLLLNCDHIIDLGPDSAHQGGEIVCEGMPEEILENKKSHTVKFLIQ